MTRVMDEHPCAELRRPDGTPVLTLPRNWAGLPLGLYNIPGIAEHGAVETTVPTILFACSGRGERWLGLAGRTHHLRTAPGMVELYPGGLEFDRMRWAGEAGHCIAVHFPSHTLHRLTQRDRETDLVLEHSASDWQLTWLANRLLDAALTGGPDRLYVEGLSLALLGRLGQRGSLAYWQGPRGGRLSPAAERRVRSLIEESLAGDLSIERLANEVQLSPDHFAHCFRSTFGVPPHRFVQRRRIAAAKRLLQRTGLPIAEIAVSVGFASQSHFTQVFRQQTGSTPAQWRRA